MRRHLTYANVVATLALVVAVGGGSTAIAISAKKAPKNSVTSAAIRDGSVTGKDLAKVRTVSAFGGNTATCAPNEKLVGGGAISFNASGQEITTATDRLQRSYPVDNAWVSQGAVNSRAYALCLAAVPGK